MIKATDSYNLKKYNPKLAKEWHPSKNGDLTPKDVTPSSDRKVWWICSNQHEWPAPISRRAHGAGCPYCSGNAICKDNCLQTKNPKLASEWHPTKNGDLSPKDVFPYSTNKVWWICIKGHSWQAQVSARHVGNGCPHCYNLKRGAGQIRPFSSPVQNLYYEIPFLSK
jgi:hypothetical protein